MARKRQEVPAAAPAAPAPSAPPAGFLDPAAASGPTLQPGEVVGQLAGVQLSDGAVVQLAELPEAELRKLAVDLQIEGANSLAVDQLVTAIQAEEVVFPGGEDALGAAPGPATGELDVGGGSPADQGGTAQISDEDPAAGLGFTEVYSSRIPAVRIRSVSPEGFRRAGRRFGPEWTTIPLAELDDDQVEALSEEPGLVLEGTYLDPAELS